jgi:hypothetical protein
MNSKNISYIVIAILVIIIYLGRCSNSTIITSPKIITIIDTITITDTVKSKPKFIKGDSIPYAKWDTMYIPDTSYRGLKRQYFEMANNYLSNRYYSDTLKIKDSITGWIFVTDTVQKNLLTGRGYAYSLSYPKVTTIITLPAPKVRQVYIGGQLSGNQSSPISKAEIGLLYKDKKDQIFGVHLGYSNQIEFGVSSYWKIKLK